MRTKLRVVPNEELQPVCQNNFYDYDTGECHHGAKRYPCSSSPHCMLKVGFPHLRSSASTVRGDER